MNSLRRPALIIALSLFYGGCSLAMVPAGEGRGGFPDLTNFSVAMRGEVSECGRQFLQPEPVGAPELDPARIDLLNWNIKKGEMPHWRADLELLGEDKHLVLIQEATQSMSSAEALPRGSAWSFAAGYASRRHSTGVATASQIEPFSACRLTAYEPWSKTPKATSMTKFALADSDSNLLVVNTHMINFSLGLKDYGYQLSSIREVLRGHNGPVIISGDFNTWRPGRHKLLRALIEDLNFEEITFEQDRRLRFFGSPLDHIFVSGISVLQAETHVVESSDHNPMTLSLSIDL